MGFLSRAANVWRMSKQMSDWKEKYPHAWDWGERCAVAAFEEMKTRPMPTSERELASLREGLSAGIMAEYQEQAAARGIPTSEGMLTAVGVAFGTMLTDLLTGVIR